MKDDNGEMGRDDGNHDERIMALPKIGPVESLPARHHGLVLSPRLHRHRLRSVIVVQQKVSNSVVKNHQSMSPHYTRNS